MTTIRLEEGQHWGLLTSDGKPAYIFELLLRHPKRPGRWIVEPMWSALQGDVRRGSGKIEMFDEDYLRKFMKPVPNVRIDGNRCIL